MSRLKSFLLAFQNITILIKLEIRNNNSVSPLF